MEKRTPEQMDEMRRKVMLDLPDYDQAEIMSCPLCKGESRLEEMLRRYYARCTKCGCNGPLMASADEAKQVWETRA